MGLSGFTVAAHRRGRSILVAVVRGLVRSGPARRAVRIAVTPFPRLRRRLRHVVVTLDAAASPGAVPEPVPDPLPEPDPDPGPVPAPGPPAHDVNVLLHEARGALLRQMPPGARRMLSAGCAGTWYFEWIERTYGRVPEHLGIEFYSPKPDDLPDNVTWIANTASDMSGVSSSSCDLVVSGQNLEHLWPEEVAGFVLEAARVLRPGGHVVVDSPNRLVTTAQNWSHPQHTIELTPEEAVRLFTLGGLDVTAVRGLWLCRDARDGAVLPFDPDRPCEGWSVTERLLCARDRPEDAFIWWIEAVRTDRPPDADAVRTLMADLFRDHWPERVQRLVVPPDRPIETTAEGDWVVSAPGQGGVVFYGPYMPLKRGRHRVTWRFRTPGHGTGPVAICDVIGETTPGTLAAVEVFADRSEVSIEFDLSETTFGLQFRCISTADEGFSVLRRIRLGRVPGRSLIGVVNGDRSMA